MKHIKLFEELNNLSKVRKWPIHKTGKWDHADLYFVYKLAKKDLGKYMNTWFVGANITLEPKTPYTKEQIITDEMITLKEVDKETADSLYHRKYNPVSIRIMCPTGSKFTKDEKGNYNNYRLKAQIHSVDDSSFGIWWDDKTFDELGEIRLRLMEWINGQLNGLNGEEFLDICVSMGADEETKDYN